MVGLGPSGLVAQKIGRRQEGVQEPSETRQDGVFPQGPAGNTKKTLFRSAKSRFPTEWGFSMCLVCSWALETESYPVLILNLSSEVLRQNQWVSHPALRQEPPTLRAGPCEFEITVGKGWCWAEGIWRWAIGPSWLTAWVSTQMRRVTRGREGNARLHQLGRTGGNHVQRTAWTRSVAANPESICDCLPLTKLPSLRRR